MHNIKVVWYGGDGNAVEECTYRLTRAQLRSMVSPDFLDPPAPAQWVSHTDEEVEPAWCSVFVDGTLHTECDLS